MSRVSARSTACIEVRPTEHTSKQVISSLNSDNLDKYKSVCQLLLIKQILISSSYPGLYCENRLTVKYTYYMGKKINLIIKACINMKDAFL